MSNVYKRSSLNKNNPRNPFSTLYRGLTRLFSGPLATYHVQNPRQLKRWQIEKYRSRFTSAQGQLFKQSQYNPFEYMYLRSMQYQNRTERYRDFNEMEYMPEIASALDIYADEMTTNSILSPLLSIECPNQEIKDIIHNLLYDTLNIEHNMFGWCRSTCKYGDFFLYLDIDEKYGVTNVMGLPIEEVERIEGEDKTNPNYVQFQWNSAGLTLENWQIAHFRILGNDKFVPYGTSVLDPARRIFRQLDLVEQMMMAYRVVRAPERRIFYLDVAGIPHQEVEQYIEEQIANYKRRQIADEETGRVDQRYKPEAVDMDFFIPVRGQNSATKVETLQGGQIVGEIDDVKYLRDKLWTALKIPQEYLTNYTENGGSTDKATLAQKDVRFARTINRLQKPIIEELEKICRTHLFILGFRGKDILSFKIKMNSPSKIAELQELEHWKTKFETAAQATEGFFSRRTIAKKVFGLSDEEILQNQREMFYDRKMDALLEATVENKFGDETEGGIGDIEGMEDLGGDSGNSSDSDEVGLLAAPGNRRQTTTPKSKGKMYTPEISDKRKSGGRKKSYLKQAGDSTAESGIRNTFPGFSNLKTLSHALMESEKILEEQKKQWINSNYNIKEQYKSIDSLDKECDNILNSIKNKQLEDSEDNE